MSGPIDRRALIVSLAAGALAAPTAAAAWVKPYRPRHRPDRPAADARAFAASLSSALHQRDAQAALVFRAGMLRRDLPPEVAYTHGAVWVHDPDADGFAVHGLFSGDGVALPRWRSTLTVETPSDFMTRAIEDDVAVVVPTPAVQSRLVELVASPTYAAMQVDRYSVVANPFARKYQNCDVFLLYLVAAAAWGLTDPDQVSQRLRSTFRPTHIRTAGIIRTFAPLVDRRVSTDDQHGAVVTATYESIAGFMQEQGLASERFTLAVRRSA